MIEGLKINQKQQERYLEMGYWGHTSLLDAWHRTVSLYSEREYVADDRGNRYTYARMDREAGAVAAWLRQAGVEAGDTVSFQIPVWSEFVVVVIACLKVGAVIHPVAMCFEEEELIHCLNQTGAKVYFAPTWFHKSDYEARIESTRDRIPSLKQVVLLDNVKEKRNDWVTLGEILDTCEPIGQDAQTSGFDLAVILGTSGTTGGSKGVMLTHNNILFSERYFNQELGLTHEDVMFMPAPLNHATGFHHGLIAPMLLGAKVVLQQRFNCGAALELMNRERCTYSMGSTPFIYDILKRMEDSEVRLEYLKFYLCGGAPVPSYMIKKADRFGIRLCEVYGSTESVPHAYVHPDEALKLDGTVSGKAMEGVEIRLVDNDRREVPPGTPGEQASRGPNVFVGYINNAAATEQVLDDDGWFYSGDICVQNEQGYIRVIGRKKDMIVRGGENLNTNEIDGYLEGCPGVADRAIIGMPDERLGERICAYIVPEKTGAVMLEPAEADRAVIEPAEADRAGAAAVTLEAIICYLSGKKIPKRFWPEHIELIGEIPRTPSGKVKKYVLLEDLEERMKHG